MKTVFIDLRNEIEFIQKRYSFFWVALRSAQLDQKCGCLDHNDLPSPSCTKCLGSGFLYVDKLIKAQRTGSTPGIDLGTSVGKINTSTVTWVIQYNNRPKETDWVLELDLDESTGMPREPFSIRRAFKIQNAFPLRGNEGKIKYWSCLSEERNFTTGTLIDKKPSRGNYKGLEQESSTSWAVRILTFDGGQKPMQMSETFTFSVKTFAGDDKTFPLSPQETPPNGELTVIDYDGEEKIANIYTI